MNRDDIIRMAREALAGYRREVALLTGGLDKQPCDAEVALRAALEQQQDPELSAALGWPGGISDPTLDRKTLLQQVAQLAQMAERAETEREACAQLCEQYDDDGGAGETWGPRFAEIIRARGSND